MSFKSGYFPDIYRQTGGSLPGRWLGVIASIQSLVRLSPGFKSDPRRHWRPKLERELDYPFTDGDNDASL